MRAGGGCGCCLRSNCRSLERPSALWLWLPSYIGTLPLACDIRLCACAVCLCLCSVLVHSCYKNYVLRLCPRVFAFVCPRVFAFVFLFVCVSVCAHAQHALASCALTRTHTCFMYRCVCFVHCACVCVRLAQPLLSDPVAAVANEATKAVPVLLLCMGNVDKEAQVTPLPSECTEAYLLFT